MTTKLRKDGQVSRRSARAFHQSADHTFWMELVLGFAERISGREASEVARRVLEAVQVAMPAVEAADSLQTCRLVCHELRQMVPLIPPTSSRE